jgi:hypothetical protein
MPATDSLGRFESGNAADMHTRYYRLWFAKSSAPFFLAISGEEPVVYALAAELVEAAIQHHGKCEPCGEQLPAALLLAVPAKAKPEEQGQTLQELADLLRHLAPVRGQALRVAALPVFLVLTQAEKLARPEDVFGTWSGRVNTLLLEKSHQFTTLLHHRVAQDRRLFGTLQMHYLAVGTHTFETTASDLVTHSSATLLRQTKNAAHYYLRRQKQQSLRTGGFSFFLIACLLFLALLGVVLGWQLYVPEQVLRPHQREPKPDPAVVLTEQLQRLLRFEGFRSPAGTQWVRWFQDADEALAQNENELVETFPQEQRDRIQRLAASVQSLRERILFLGLVRMDKPPIPVLQPMTEPVPSLPQLCDRAGIVRNYLQQRSLFVTEKEWPGEIPAAVVRELQATAQRAYDAWLDPLRWHLRQAVSERNEDKREVWLQIVQTWLPVEALPHLEEWRVVARYLQQQAGLPLRDVIEELTTFVERDQTTLDMRHVKVQMPSSMVGNDGKKLDLRVMALRLEWRKDPSKPSEVETWHYRWERQTPVLGSDTAIHEFNRLDAAGDNGGSLVFRSGQSLTATVEAVDQQNQRWLILWSPLEQVSRWYSLHIFTESPRLVPAQQADPRQGSLVSQARWLLPSMDAWKLPDLWPRPTMLK